MQLWEYTLLSLIGVVLCHYFSELYSIKNKIIYFVCYLFILGNVGGQHYNIMFNKEFIDPWLFFIKTTDSYFTDTYRYSATIFMILTILTLPRSKLRFLPKLFTQQ